MELRKGYKLTEVGVIPEDWDVRSLGSLIHIKNGFAFSSTYFSNKGPIILTPGNFKLEGGLYFNHRNTKRYSGDFPNAFRFQKGDLLIVMTDLTPDCNLLGKPAFVDKDNLLHNQRIGKIIPLNKGHSLRFLYCFLNSATFNKRMKETATGSTVRHTSIGSICGTLLSFPPTKAEQIAIANALSDADAWIQSLTRLIAKKRQIKQGAMQTLLNPYENGRLKEGWVIKKLGDISHVVMGQSPSSQNYNYKGIGMPLVQGNADIKNRKTIIRTYTSEITKKCTLGDIIMSVRAPVGEIAVASFDACIGRGVCAINYPNNYLFHYLVHIENSWGKLSKGSTFDSVTSREVKELNVFVPNDIEKQSLVAGVLSDMDNEITILETKLAKAQKIKQGMMQNLLTGRIRLI